MISIELFAIGLSVLVVIGILLHQPSSTLGIPSLLVFMGVGVELSGLLSLPESNVAGMLLVASALDKLLNAAFFATFSLADRRRTPNKASAPQAKSGED